MLAGVEKGFLLFFVDTLPCTGQPLLLLLLLLLSMLLWAVSNVFEEERHGLRRDKEDQERYEDEAVELALEY